MGKSSNIWLSDRDLGTLCARCGHRRDSHYELDPPARLGFGPCGADRATDHRCSCKDFVAGPIRETGAKLVDNGAHDSRHQIAYQIACDLGACEPPLVADPRSGCAVCALCQHVIPIEGAARVLTLTDSGTEHVVIGPTYQADPKLHGESCPWRRAVELLESGS